MWHNNLYRQQKARLSELGRRYERLIREQRQRKFEREWENRNMDRFHASRKKKSQSSGGGCASKSSGRSLRGSSANMDMTCQEKEEME